MKPEEGSANVIIQEHRRAADSRVDMWEWFWGKNIVLETTGLVPCAGVIIYDKRSKIGVVGHFPHPINGDHEEMFGQLKDLFKNNLSQVEVYLSGTSPTMGYPELGEDTNAELEIIHLLHRKRLLEDLNQLGIREEQIHQHWTEEGKGTEMTLDMPNKRVRITSSDAYSFENESSVEFLLE